MFFFISLAVELEMTIKNKIENEKRRDRDKKRERVFSSRVLPVFLIIIFFFITEFLF